MSVEIQFPIEFMVPGVPLSLQASAASKEEWKERIRTAARPELPEGHFAAQEPMKVTIYYFADAPAKVAIDNIVKPIFDSLSRFIYLDDKHVERLVVQKFEPGRLFTFASPSPRLAETIDAGGPRVYMQVDVSTAGEVPWVQARPNGASSPCCATAMKRTASRSLNIPSEPNFFQPSCKAMSQTRSP